MAVIEDRNKNFQYARVRSSSKDHRVLLGKKLQRRNGKPKKKGKKNIDENFEICCAFFHTMRAKF